jgi:hypothetical protein
MKTVTRFSISRICMSLATALILVVLSLSCQRQMETKDQAPTRDINAVMADHTEELMAIPGVAGVAIGELDDHTPCILVLVEEETAELKAKIPEKLEGHPTKLYVTGKIVPMDSE